MHYINPLENPPEGVTHHTFYSEVIGHALGYHVYLPPGYADGGKRYPVAYHLHGWTGSEASEVHTMLPVCRAREAITVFPNNSPVIEERSDLPVEAMFFTELMPLIEANYRTLATREGRSLSGFSMGGGAAFVYAVKHPELFAVVTPYAGTYHHYYDKTYRGVEEPVEKAAGFYETMLKEGRDREAGNILCVIREQAEQIRGRLEINMHIGTDDPLICDNEIMHLYLTDMGIAHAYKLYEGVGHTLAEIM